MPSVTYNRTECTKCQGPLYLYNRANVPGPHAYEVACNVCGTMYYQGDNATDANSVLYKYLKPQYITTFTNSMPVPPTTNNPITVQVPRTMFNTIRDKFSAGDFIKVKCNFTTAINGNFYSFAEDDIHRITYLGPTNTKLVKDGIERVINTQDLDDNFCSAAEEKITVVNTNLTMMEAYEANKVRETCIVCGNKTVRTDVCMTVIQYCKCVNKLPR